MDLVFMLSAAVFAVVVVGTSLVARRRPSGWRPRFLPYLYIYSAAAFAYLGYTAHQRKAWWFVPPVIFLMLGIKEFARQWKIAKTGQANAHPQP